MMKIPPLPLPGERLYFPVGTFEVVTWGPELMNAEQLGCRVQVLEGIEYDPEPEAFTDYIATLYKMKQQGGAMKVIAKFAMNSLYGKFAERGNTWTLISGELPKPGVKGSPLLDTVLNDELGIIARTGYRESPHMLHHIGGWITSCARVQLHTILMRSQGTAYCDTDSVWSETDFPADDNLGGLHTEPVSSCYFAAAKLYCYSDSEGRHVAAAKGMPGGDPCTRTPGRISGLCTIREYANTGKLFHKVQPRKMPEIILDRKRLGGLEFPYVTRPPVAGRDCPDRILGAN
jgi:hypothetical protein